MSVTDKATALKKQIMVQALTSTMGIISPACIEAGVSRSAFYNWLNNDSKFAEDCHNIKESAKDFAETSLLTQIREKNTTATIFYLKTQCRDRGYVEKVDAIVRVADDLSDKSVDELLQLIETLDIKIASAKRG